MLDELKRTGGSTALVTLCVGGGMGTATIMSGICAMLAEELIYRSPQPEVVIPDLPLPAYVLERMQRFGSRPALVDSLSGRTITYAEAVAAIRGTAAALVADGFASGEVVAFLSPNSLEFPIAFHAVGLAGGTVTPMVPLGTRDDLVRQLRDSGASLLIVDAALADRGREAAATAGTARVRPFKDASDALVRWSDAPAPEVVIDPATALVALPYSSGTTGRPKASC